ncbi:nuclear transport factor 2 family protein [Thalassobaculum sp.]|uniref:nuclear transport factor 2 family protein n=1 Tax=Thalassobaculum sp. TaxID=2022740 RepID=UPI0032EF0DC6
MSTAYAELVQAMDLHFDGFYTGDVETLKKVFHPDCHLISGTGGSLANDPMEAVYARVRGRAKPSEAGQRRYDHILSIDLAGPETALVTCRIALEPKLFTDYLNFVKLDGQWRIVSKVYTWVPVNEAAGAHPVTTAQAAE